MSKVFRIQVDKELSFLVETQDEPITVYNENAEILGELPPEAILTGALLDKVRDLKHTVAAVITYMQKGVLLAMRPDEFTLEFSLALKGTAGIPVVVNHSAEGTFKISATWKKREKGRKEVEVE